MSKTLPGSKLVQELLKEDDIRLTDDFNDVEHPFVDTYGYMAATEFDDLSGDLGNISVETPYGQSIRFNNLLRHYLI